MTNALAEAVARVERMRDDYRALERGVSASENMADVAALTLLLAAVASLPTLQALVAELRDAKADYDEYPMLDDPARRYYAAIRAILDWGGPSD